MIHPEIKKFWEDYYNKSVLKNEEPLYYFIEVDTKSIIILAASLKTAKHIFMYKTDLNKFKDNELIYFLFGFYNEEEVLRRIKLKAFL